MITVWAVTTMPPAGMSSPNAPSSAFERDRRADAGDRDRRPTRSGRRATASPSTDASTWRRLAPMRAQQRHLARALGDDDREGVEDDERADEQRDEREDEQERC